MAAVHANAPDDRKAFSLVASAFMIIFATLTSGVHFVWLTVLRQTPFEAVPLTLRPDPWPSTLTALDMLAWGRALGLSLSFRGAGLHGRQTGEGHLHCPHGRRDAERRRHVGTRPWRPAVLVFLVLPVIGSLLVLHFRSLNGDSSTAAEWGWTRAGRLTHRGPST
jgi:hypothetical protein